MTGPEQKAQKSCFVIMPVTTPIFYAEKFNDPDHFNHVLTHLFTPALNDVGYKVIPPSAQGAQLIHAEIIKNLEQASLVLCDLSTLNPNVFFELGIRTSLDRPVVLVKDNLTANIPFDLNAINTLTYDSALVPWTLDGEMTRLVEHVKHAIDSADSSNSMWKYFGLTKRGTPAQIKGDPIIAKLDFLIKEVEKSQPTTRDTRLERAQDTAAKTIFKSITEGILSQYRMENDIVTSINESDRSVDIYIIDTKYSIDDPAEGHKVGENLRREIQEYTTYRVSVTFTPF